MQTLTRGLAIIEALYGRPDGLSLHELSERLKCPKPSLLRLLDTLVERGYLRLDPASGHYGLDAIQILRASNVYRPTSGRCATIHRLLEDLSRTTDETAVLGIVEPQHGLALPVDYVEPPHAVRAVPPLFHPAPVLRMSVGRAWLAQLSDAEAAEVAQQWAAATGGTPEDVAQALAELDDVRSLGYAATVGGFEEGLAAASVAVTDARHQALGVVSVIAPASRMTPERLEDIGKAVRTTAQMLSNIFARDFVGDVSRWQREMAGASRAD